MPLGRDLSREQIWIGSFRSGIKAACLSVHVDSISSGEAARALRLALVDRRKGDEIARSGQGRWVHPDRSKAVDGVVGMAMNWT